MAHRAAPISVSIAQGHASANAVKATAGGWSTGSSACLTSPLLSHLSHFLRHFLQNNQIYFPLWNPLYALIIKIVIFVSVINLVLILRLHLFPLTTRRNLKWKQTMQMLLLMLANTTFLGNKSKIIFGLFFLSEIFKFHSTDDRLKHIYK